MCLVYTAVGGLWADAITDTVQFVLMCVSLAVAMPLATGLVGGFESLRAHVPAEHLTQTGGVSGWVIMAWSLSALTVFVEPAFYQRIFAARDAKQVRRAMIIGIFLWAAYDWGATLIGMAARAAVDLGLLPGDLEGRAALVALCLKTLPVGLKGLFVAGVLAAAMSSIDSYTLLASGNLVYDIIRPLFRPDWGDRTLIRLTRLGIVATLVPSVLLALYFERISDAWIFMASFLTSVVLVPAMAGLYSRPKPLAGVLSSMFGLGALILAHGALHILRDTLGDGAGSIDVEYWRHCAVLFALPVSVVGLLIGQILGKERADA